MGMVVVVVLFVVLVTRVISEAVVLFVVKCLDLDSSSSCNEGGVGMFFIVMVDFDNDVVVVMGL